MTSSTATTARFAPTLPSTAAATAQASAATPPNLQRSSLAFRAGQGQWLYLEAGSSLYCNAGQLQISSPWHSGLRLVAEDAPHCNGAHAGWYWLQAEGLQPAQLLVQVQAYAGWGAGWRSVANWLGLLGWKD
ncbi:hypothetical protein HS961_20235 [Comamonas piscis]|uniref:Uncharacterized protein n=1 Tax=Comamonas piscis TaxID=1562974 RepID=A0A7G5ELV5_9BURK|nr:hypothetical protein [Comamonas piscis]QMV74980.1 hypothetical protein HS961_20235 [Comamonas piscis]WSO33459.1 hypothetical protein VUJ63_20300 [Comamonas piscis]